MRIEQQIVPPVSKTTIYHSLPTEKQSQPAEASKNHFITPSSPISNRMNRMQQEKLAIIHEATTTTLSVSNAKGRAANKKTAMKAMIASTGRVPPRKIRSVFLCDRAVIGISAVQ
tara:strand:- start:7954 stop:8298 length:345 start_codon:yes stop_codon:yes gene_type:complete